MFTSGTITSKLLIWLTAIAMPFQVGWAATCDCCPGDDGAAAVELQPISSSCCRKVADTEPTCCAKSTSQRTCCKMVSNSDRRVGCECGPSCQCVSHDKSPPQPPTPAPDSGRSQTAVESSAFPLSAICVPVADNSGHVLAAEIDSALCESGSQVCVLLCRFTL